MNCGHGIKERNQKYDFFFLVVYTAQLIPTHTYAETEKETLYLRYQASKRRA